MSDLIMTAVESSSLFEDLSPEHKEQLRANASIHRCAHQDVIIAEGTQVTFMYLVVEGVVRVSTHSVDREVELKKLGVGSYFGEVSLLSGKEATATVAVLEAPCTLVVIERDAVLDILSQYPSVRRLLEGVTLARAKDTIAKVLK